MARTVIASVLVGALTLMGPAMTQAQAADAPPTRSFSVSFPSWPATANLGISYTQPLPSSRWSLVAYPGPHGLPLAVNSSRDTVPLIDVRTSFADLGAMPRYSASLSPLPDPAAVPASGSGHIRKGMLVLGIAGAAVAVFGGVILGEKDSHCSSGGNSVLCRDAGALGGGLLGAGLGMAGVGFFFAFWHR